MTDSVVVRVEFLIVVSGGDPAAIESRVLALMADLQSLGVRAATFRVEDGNYIGIAESSPPLAAADSGESS